MGFSFGQRYGMETLGQVVAYDIRNHLYNHIQRLSFSYHAHTQTGQLMSRMSEDVSAIQRFVAGALLDMLSILLMLVVIVVILLRARLAAGADHAGAHADPGPVRILPGQLDAATLEGGPARHSPGSAPCCRKT